jgi:predicted O-methyltransferase YrrM
MADDYEFTTDWFSPSWQNWLTLTADRKISKILEIGSFEGRSTCAMIGHFGKQGPLHLFCIDNFQGSPEHQGFDMAVVEERFNRNVNRAITRVTNRVAVYKHKGQSVEVLSGLMKDHQNSFDLVFVDGSHYACDVLTDLVLSYHLCAVGGLIICDDYLWNNTRHGAQDLLMMPRIAIDAFAHTFIRKVAQPGGLKLYQAYFVKTA